MVGSFVVTSHLFHGVLHIRSGGAWSCPVLQHRSRRSCVSTPKPRLRLGIRASASGESSDAERGQAGKNDGNIDWDSSWQNYKGEADEMTSGGSENDPSPGDELGSEAPISEGSMSAGKTEEGSLQENQDSGGVFRIATEESPVKEMLDERTNRFTDAWSNESGFLAGIGVIFLVGCFYLYAWTHQGPRY
jgi:hypothetical protein